MKDIWYQAHKTIPVTEALEGVPRLRGPGSSKTLERLCRYITRPALAEITPARRGSGAKAVDTRTPTERHRAMRWAQRLKRVFQLDLESCEGCGGQVRVMASLEDPLVIGKILEHLERTGPGIAGAGRRPAVRGPPPGALDGGWIRTSD